MPSLQILFLDTQGGQRLRGESAGYNIWLESPCRSAIGGLIPSQDVSPLNKTQNCKEPMYRKVQRHETS